jgi:hypothetical protein
MIGGHMATSPAYALAHVFLPNQTKLRGAATIISAIERKEVTFFDPVWAQAFVKHAPKLHATTREAYRIGVVDLPPPKDLGEAHMVGWVAKHGDPAFARYFTLEHDYVLATRSDRTMVCERTGQQHTRHFEGPALTGDFAQDAAAFVDGFMELMIPTKVTRT